MAEGKRYYWLKLKDDFFTSKRIKKLRKLAGGDTYTIIYLKMQLLAMKKDGVIEYTGLENTFEDELALDLDEDPNNIRVTLNYLLSCDLCECSDNVTFFFPYSVENVGSENSSAARVRSFRDRQKALQSNTDVTQALHCNDDVTQVKRLCNGEIEKEIDKRDRDRDREDTDGGAPAPSSSTKVPYADNVKLTEDEHQKLVDQYGAEDTERLIQILDNYKGQSGKKYKSDYRAILNWCVDRLKKDKEKDKRKAQPAKAPLQEYQAGPEELRMLARWKNDSDV